MEFLRKPQYVLVAAVVNLCLFVILAQISRDRPITFQSATKGVEVYLAAKSDSGILDRERVSKPQVPAPHIGRLNIKEIFIPEDCSEVDSPKNLKLPAIAVPNFRFSLPKAVLSSLTKSDGLKSDQTITGTSHDLNREGSSFSEGSFRIAQVDEPPVPVFKRKPLYPLRARRLGVEGKVTIQFIVERDGSVSDLRILSAKPKGYFEKSVIHAVRRWRFIPGKVRGHSVRTVVVVPIKFKLRK